MLDSVLAGQCCVHARAIARIPNGPNSIIIIVSNLGQELCFQNASVAYGEARNQTASIDQGHLEAICVAMQQCEVRVVSLRTLAGVTMFWAAATRAIPLEPYVLERFAEAEPLECFCGC